MRWIMPFCLIGVCIGSGCTSRKEAPAARNAARDVDVAKGEFVLQKPGADPADDKKAPAEKPRKIKYTADLHLIVEDFDKAVKDFKVAMKQNKAHEAKSEINGSANTVRSGVWHVRVPVEQFDDFREAVRKLGEVEKDIVDSEDLTDRYYDLDAHIQNRKAARDAMRDLLKETGKRDMEQYLKVYDKLEIVNDEINRKEGQLRLWANLTDLTTVTVRMREKQKYLAEKGPQPNETPTFGMRAGKTWHETWDSFVGFWQGMLLVVIALAPWLPIALAFVFGIGVIVRRRGRAANEQVVVVVEEPAESKKA